MVDVQYNNHMYSYETLWNSLHADNIISDFYRKVGIWIGDSPFQNVKEREGSQIMSDLVVREKENYGDLTVERGSLLYP